MKNIRNLYFGAMVGLVGIGSAQLVEINEADYVDEDSLVLVPGTRITGGITPSGDRDTYYLPDITPRDVGSYVFTIDYTHSSNFLSPAAHLKGEVFTEYEERLSGSVAVFPRRDIGGSFFLGNAPNRLQARVPASSLSAAGLPEHRTFRNAVSVLPVNGGRNSSYQLTLEYDPEDDAYDSTLPGNNVKANAVELSPHDPSGTLFGDDRLTFGDPDDRDWFSFVPATSGTYKVRLARRTEVTGLGNPQVSVSNELGQVVSAPVAQLSLWKTSEVIISVVAGTRYFIEASPLAGKRYVYMLAVFPTTHEEPEQFSELRSREFIHLIDPATNDFLPNEGLLTPYFTIDSYGDGFRLADEDFFSISPFNFDGRDFDYKGYVEFENEEPPSGARGEIVGKRKYFYESGLSSDVGFKLFLRATKPEQTGMYRLFLRPYNDFDNWAGYEYQIYSLTEDVEVNGLALGIAYALDRDPKLNHGDLLRPVVFGNQVSALVPLPSGGTQAPLEIQQSLDLQTWETVPAEFLNQPAGIIPKGTNGTLSVTYPLDAPRRYLRLKMLQ